MNIADHEIHFRAPRFSVVSARAECFKCGQEISVFALLLPPEHVSLNETVAGGKAEAGAVLLSDLQVASPRAAAAIREATGGLYRIDHSKTAQDTYFMNHCSSCGIKQGDWYLHDVDGAFFFGSERQFAGLEVTHIDIEAEIGSASANYGAGEMLWEFFQTGAIPDQVISNE
jgi:hypothetical protein